MRLRWRLNWQVVSVVVGGCRGCCPSRWVVFAAAKLSLPAIASELEAWAGVEAGKLGIAL
jgi:hypothetical protein